MITRISMYPRTCSSWVRIAAFLLTLLGQQVSAAQLSGWAEPTPTAVNLTAVGTIDWAHWGAGSGVSPWFDHKASGGGQISQIAAINNGPFGNDANSLMVCSWSDGSPTASATGTTSDIRMINTGDGVTITVPADTSPKTLRIYVTVYNAGGTFSAHLSDGSAPDYADGSFFSTGGSSAACYVLVYSAATGGQTLSVSWRMGGQLGSWGSANLHAAALAAGTASPATSAPGVPGRLSAIPGDGMVTLHWQRLSGAKTYNLYAATGTTPPTSPTHSGLTAFTAPSTPNSEGFLVEYADTAVSNGTAYTYWVSEVDTAGHESALSEPVTATPTTRPTSANTTSRVLKILPLGDSITEGSPGAPTVPDGGYRQALLTLLGSAGYQPVFMGSSIELSGSMTDPYHEGWPGRTIRQIRDDVMPRALVNDDPDLMLLMIGTNDLAWGHKNSTDVTSAINAYAQLLTGIFARKPGITLLVSPILPIDNGSDSAGAANQAANVTSFNFQLLTLVQSFATAGHAIIWVQGMASFPASGDQVDGVHPNTAGYAFLANAWLTSIQAITGTARTSAPEISQQPTGQFVSVGQAATFTVAASGNPAPTYQWSSAPAGGSFAPIAGATSASYTTPAATLAQSGMQFEVEAMNSVGSATSIAATLSVVIAANAPTITTQPSDMSVAAGQAAAFTVVAAGSAPLVYAWSHGGSAVGGSNATLSIQSAQSGDAGSYVCVVTNGAGSATSSAANLTVSSASLDPLIVGAAFFNDGAGAWGGASNTADKAYDGDTATYYDCATANGGYTGIDVGAGATATVTSIRCWARAGFSGRMNGGVLDGSNSPTTGYTTLATVTSASSSGWTTLTIAGATPYRYLRYRGPDGGNCNVAEIEFHGTTAGGGGTASGSAPSITTQPMDQTVLAGQTATFTVVAAGTALLSYQWNLGSAVVGNAETLTISNAQAANAGAYTVTVANAAGSTVSLPATLTVNPLSAPSPSITSVLTASGVVGQPFMYQITASAGTTGFLATPLPPGLTIDVSTGLISGSPVTAGNTTVSLTAITTAGAAQAGLMISIAAAAGISGGTGESRPGPASASGSGSGCGLGAGVAAWFLALGGLAMWMRISTSTRLCPRGVLRPVPGASALQGAGSLRCPAPDPSAAAGSLGRGIPGQACGSSSAPPWPPFPLVLLACALLLAPLYAASVPEVREQGRIDKARPLRLLCLGDSITTGWSYDNAYRLLLQEQLQAAGYTISYVGTRMDHGSTMHDGWPGYQMVKASAPAGKDQDSMASGGISTSAEQQIYGAVIAKAMTTDPDVVLLMIGVNDLFYPDYLNPVQRGREFALVLDQILSLKPTVSVIIAPITYRRGAVDPGQCDAVSDASRAVVAERAAAGKDVHWAPNAGGGSGGSISQSDFDLPDSVHPASADAYRRIANGFFNAIVEATAGNAASAPTVGFARAGGMTAGRWPGSLPLEVDSGGHGTLAYRWSQVAGPGKATFAPADQPRTVLGFDRSGTYQVRLTVTNGSGLHVSKDVAVEMNEYPTGLVADPGPGTLTLRWNRMAPPGDPSEVISYRVSYGLQPAGPYPTVIDHAHPPVVISGLSKGVTYYLVVTPVHALPYRSWDGAASEPLAGIPGR
ncbi:MAG: immunoglobulin domain-containing protein [Planctomycetes bacterium]|nr:immunoglobulin domain-containing protein [Planctomycetota bacterium]